MAAKKSVKKSAKKKAQPGADTPVRRRGVSPASEGGEWSALEESIVKERGEGVVFSAINIPPACHIPTGAFTLDFGLLGGVAEGYATMFLGKESSGKTTMALNVVAEYQRKYPNRLAVWVDTENLFDRDWAKTQGCDLQRLKLIQPATGEEAVDLISAAMGAIEVGIVVLDSVPGCVPKAVDDRSAEDKTRGALAALMGLLCSKVLLSWSAERKRGHRVTFIPINQYRAGLDMYGPSVTSPGGKQINHLPTTKIEIKNKPEMGEDGYGNEVVDYNDHSFQLTKTKHGASIKQGMFQMVINPDKDPDMPQGTFDDYKTVITFAKRFGMVKGGGGKYRLPILDLGDTSFRTFDDIYAYLKENKHHYRILRGCIIAMQRIVKGLTPIPPDGYLVAPGIGEKIPVHAILELIEEEGAGTES